MSNNKTLYESEDVVSKYTANTTRMRSLNVPEKILIDRYDVKNKNVLVVGGGAGRMPLNLLLYGNRVTSVDRSHSLTAFAHEHFSQSKFPDLTFIEADAVDLSMIENDAYDVVIFPMNAIDYIDTYDARLHAMKEALLKLKKGGTFVFSSHNKRAYIFSPKVRMKDRKITSLFGDFRFVKESVIGGGCIFKGNPAFIIRETVAKTGLRYLGSIHDTRTKVDKLFAKFPFLAKYYFPYIVYVFTKE
jgi:SAM-dependent methyltransferase